MKQNKEEFLHTLKAVTGNDKLRREMISRFDSLPVNPHEYSALKSLIKNNVDIDFLSLEASLIKLKLSKKTSIFLLIKFLDEIKNIKVSTGAIASMPNYDRKIPEGIIHLEYNDTRHIVILFLLYSLDFDCGLVGFRIDDKLIPTYSEYMKFTYITQTQFRIVEYAEKIR